MGAIGCVRWVGEQLVDLSGDVTFEAADDLAAVFAVVAPFMDIGDGWLVAAHAGGGDLPEGLVGLAVPAAVETVTDGTTRGRLDRAYAAQSSERGF